MLEEAGAESSWLTPTANMIRVEASRGKGIK